MNALQLFLTQIGLSLGVSTVVVVLWTKPLKTLLADICETNARATFWVTYSNIMLYMAPLLTIVLFGHSMMAGPVEIFFYKNAMGCILFGLFCALVVIGFQISRFIPKANEHAVNVETKKTDVST